MYDRNGKITRSGAEQVIRQGGSVLLNGNLHTRVDSLPDEAAFAQGDDDAEVAARENLLRQRDALDDQIARLGAKSAKGKRSAGAAGGPQVPQQQQGGRQQRPTPLQGNPANPPAKPLQQQAPAGQQPDKPNP